MTTELGFLNDLVRRGGPEPREYTIVADCFRELGQRETPPDTVAQVFAPTLTPECIHGYGYLKPRGYAGDFEIIDRIYTRWTSPDPRLVRWDRFFHEQSAPKAVRNRKEFFKKILRELEDQCNGFGADVLNVGCGPGRDIYEYFQSAADSRIRVMSLDLDPEAIRHAGELCRPFLDRVGFACENVLRHVPDKKYNLVWAAGLFDYFSDRLFVRAAKRLLHCVKKGGQLVIGNFGPDNPSRAYMELLGQWRLEHRSASRLLQMAADAGCPPGSARIEQEPEGVNLFLRVLKI